MSIFWKNFLFHKFFTVRDFFVFTWLSLNIFWIAINLDVIFENQFKLVLKLRLKDQILINFTKPNSYFSYVSEHDSWVLISLSWDLMTLFFSKFATCRLCICLIFEFAMLVQLNQYSTFCFKYKSLVYMKISFMNNLKSWLSSKLHECLWIN